MGEEVLVADDTDGGTKIDAQTIEPIIIDGKEYIKVTTKYNAASWFLNKKNKVIIAVLIILAVIATICTLGIILGFSGIIIKSITTRVQIKSAASRISGRASFIAGRRLRNFSLEAMVDLYVRIMNLKGNPSIKDVFEIMKEFSAFLQGDLAKIFAKRDASLFGEGKNYNVEGTVVKKEDGGYVSIVGDFMEKNKTLEKDELRKKIIDYNAFLYNYILDWLYNRFEIIYKEKPPTVSGDDSFGFLVLGLRKNIIKTCIILSQYKKVVSDLQKVREKYIGYNKEIQSHDPTTLKEFYSKWTKTLRYKLLGKKLELDISEGKFVENAEKAFIRILGTEIARWLTLQGIPDIVVVTSKITSFLEIALKKIKHDIIAGFEFLKRDLFIIFRPLEILYSLVTGKQDEKKLANPVKNSTRTGEIIFSMIGSIAFILLLPIYPMLMAAWPNVKEFMKTGGNEWDKIRDLLIGYSSKELLQRFAQMFASPFHAFTSISYILYQDTFSGQIVNLEAELEDLQKTAQFKESGRSNITIEKDVAKIIEKLDHDPLFFKDLSPVIKEFESVAPGEKKNSGPKRKKHVVRHKNK